MNKLYILPLAGVVFFQGAYATSYFETEHTSNYYDLAGMEHHPNGSYVVKVNWCNDEPARPTSHDNCESLSRREFITRTKHADIIQGLLNKETCAQAREAVTRLEDRYYGNELREIQHFIYLLAFRETAKRNDFNTALNMVRAISAKWENRDIAFAIHWVLRLAVEYGYADIYEFLINHDPNPRAQDCGFTLMDLLDQGRDKFGDNSNYRKMEQDLLRRGVRLNKRGDSCCKIA